MAGPNRVKAWIYNVINPLLAALEHPLDLVKGRRWSWRGHRGALEWIRPVTELLDPDQLPNLEDFRENNVLADGAVRAWDEAARALESAAAAEYTHLEKSPTFRDEINASVAAYKAGKTDLNRWGGWEEENVFRPATELVVNNVDKLITDNAYADFWRTQRDRILAATEKDEVWKRLHETSTAAGAALQERGTKLVHALKDARKDYANQFDIPLARPSQG